MKLLKKYILIALALVMVFSLVPGLPAQALAAEPIMKVKLKNTKFVGNKSELRIIPDVTYSTNLSNIKLEANNAYMLKVNGSNINIFKGTTLVEQVSQLIVKPEKGKGPLSINGHKYLGEFTFINEEGKYIRPINSLGLEDYLKGVVPAEMPALWNQEALKSQAVAARTYAMSYINKTTIPDDTESYQVYGGYAWHENSTKAVEATGGQIIAYGSTSIGNGAVFSSSNGGKTESNTNAWGGTPLPYLTIKEDNNDPKSVWSFNIKKIQIDRSKLNLNSADAWWGSTSEAEAATMAKLKTWIKANEKAFADKDIKIAAIPALSIKEAGTGGRAKKFSITIEFLSKEQGKAVLNTLKDREISAVSLRGIIGTHVMKSYLTDPVANSADRITVSGKGFGHGVGLSQYGAKKAGESGQTYKQILAFYYDKTTIITVYETNSIQPVPVNPAPAPVIPAPTPTPVPTVPQDETAPTITGVKSSYDSKTKQTRLNFALNENAKVTVQVKNSSGKVLSTLVNGVQKTAGAQTAVWNVANINNGKYTFVITAEDASKNKRTASVTYILVKPLPKDTTAPIISNTATSMKSNVVSLKYQLNEAAKATILVKDGKGKTVAAIATNLQKQKGISWAAWNASKAANGKYTFNITAVDASNNKRIANVPYTLKKPAPAPKVMTGTVNVTKLNVRATPSTSGKLLGSLKKNQKVTVISKSGSWYKIKFGKGTAYVHIKYLSKVK